MKKVIYSVLFFVSLMFAYSAEAAVVCNQTFEGTYLRYDKTYRFYDTLTNGTNTNVYVNTRKIRFIDDMGATEVMTSRYLDPGSAFDWTQTLKNSNYTVTPGQTMRIIETGATKWRIDQKPAARTQAKRNSHDFMIYYQVGYDYSNNYPNASDDIQHVECQYFSVTWCGDGVRDAGYEVCDPSDPTHTGWGNGGCNASCEPINVNPPSTCDGLTATPQSGMAPLNVSMSCTGTRATSYQIACGNGQVINGATGTCSYATNSNYQARCTVNGSITSNACQKTITVTAPTPAIRIDKTDANSADIDSVIGNDTQTVATGKVAVFKIRVTNTGDEDLKNIKVTDPIEASCAGSVTLPGTKPSTWSNFVVSGNGDHNDAFLQPGEYFEYTCEKPNTTAPYSNRANTEGTGKTSNIKVTDTDDTQVLLVTPSVQVIKTDANPVDQDAQTGNDSQTVNVGEKAVFKIRVVNDGTEDLKSLILTDSIAPNCGGSVTLPGTKPSTWSNFVVSGNGDHNDTFLQPGEYFEYTCEKPNTLSNYTNEVFVSGIGRYSDKTVNDDDPTVVVVTQTVPACSSLSVSPATGAIPLNVNAVCSTANASSVKLDCGNGQIFTSATLGGAEIFQKTCNYTTIGTYTPTCYVNDTITSTACQKTVTATEQNPVYDLALVKKISSTTPGPFNIGGTVTFDITVYNQGTVNANNVEVTDYIPTGFTLNDTNWIGSADSVTPGINNYYAKRTIAALAAGQSITLPITFTINAEATGSIVNYAEISKDDGDDCDSTPDAQNGNQSGETLATGMINDDTGNGCNTGGDEDDHDPETITIGGTVGPAISIDKVDANTADLDGNVGNDTQTVNVGNKAVFKIRVTNTGTEALKNLVLTDAIAPNCAGSVTLPGTYPSTFLTFTTAGNGDHTNTLLDVGEYFEYTCERPSTASGYTNSATVNGEGNTSNIPVTDTDTSVVLIPGTSSSSSSSGGTPNQCYSIEQTGDTITCVGDRQTQNFKLECGNGKEIISGDALDLTSSSRKYWNFDISGCDYDTTPKTTIAQCYVATRVGGSPAWRTRFACQLTGTSYCGDGIIQRPNANGQNEVCEKVVNSDGTLGAFPSFCNNSCQFTGGGSSSSSSSSGGCTNPNGCGVITIPNQGDIVFGPQGNMVIGHGTNPLVENGVMPFIRNDSDYDLYFDQICVNKVGSSLDGQQTQCKNLGDILYPGEIVKFDTYPNYTGNKNNIPASQSYANNELVTTIKTGGVLYDFAYFAAKLGVRVSKPAVATTGGGTSLVKDTTKMANISEVADGIENTDNNKNFVGVGVTGGNTSSFSDTVTDATGVDTISSEGDAYNDSIEKVSNTDVLVEALTGVTGLAQFTNYNGLENVYILKGKNLTLTNIPATLKGARTYIIEGGNLNISGNLEYGDNIAFVVRGGNIIVDDVVTKISGTYISIPVSGIGGNIKAEPTDKQLVVAGSLYGNITDLVDNRYYVDNNSTTGVINVGTIVKFGSSLFKKPAPLVGQFISEYLATQKVSQ